MKLSKTALLVFVFLLADMSVAEQQAFSPNIHESRPSQVFWGDTHLHSDLSTDAMGFGVRLGPDTAYRFAAGEEVTSSGGRRAKLGRPLDFVVLADHAESLGVMSLVKSGDSRVLVNDATREWNRLLNGSPEEQAQMRAKFLTRKERQKAFRMLSELSGESLQLDIWNSTLEIAEQHNKPGLFTTLLGYEWTSAPGGNNLHRVVLFRDGIETVKRVRPLPATQSDDPIDLWAYLAAYEKKTGGSVLAIPHNGNLSNGLMFPSTERLRGQKVDREYLELRARWEPVYEVTQIKGDGETHPLLSPDDAFADYETWDMANMGGVPKTPDMLPREYARAGLRSGLQLAAQSGVNPYQYGLIGSTDSHTSLTAVEEDNFFGKHSGVEPDPQRWDHLVGKSGERFVKGWQQASSGYAAVWATENSRQALFDAIQRREVYATTGPRMTVRLFGGWDFTTADVLAPDLSVPGYRRGVPMGGVLTGGESRTPGFLVSASKDSIGANLDRVQIIKGWLDAKGQTHEKVYNVAWSGERTLDKHGELPDVGNTVNVASASWQNSIGAPQLVTHWVDPDFEPSQSAFYYARVIEIPTPRWTAYDQKRFDSPMPDEVPMITRERAYTSPIWYQPDLLQAASKVEGAREIFVVSGEIEPTRAEFFDYHVDIVGRKLPRTLETDPGNNPG